MLVRFLVSALRWQLGVAAWQWQYLEELTYYLTVFNRLLGTEHVFFVASRLTPMAQTLDGEAARTLHCRDCRMGSLGAGLLDIDRNARGNGPFWPRLGRLFHKRACARSSWKRWS